MMLAEIVDSHNNEFDAEDRNISEEERSKEEAIKRTVDRANGYYLDKIKTSNKKLWFNPEREKY